MNFVNQLRRPHCPNFGLGSINQRNTSPQLDLIIMISPVYCIALSLDVIASSYVSLTRSKTSLVLLQCIINYLPTLTTLFLHENQQDGHRQTKRQQSVMSPIEESILALFKWLAVSRMLGVTGKNTPSYSGITIFLIYTPWLHYGYPTCVHTQYVRDWGIHAFHCSLKHPSPSRHDLQKLLIFPVVHVYAHLYT